MIQSDYAGPTGAEGPQLWDGRTGQPLGRVFDLADWPGEDGLDRNLTLAGQGFDVAVHYAGSAEAAEATETTGHIADT